MTDVIKNSSADPGREKPEGHAAEAVRIPPIVIHAYCEAAEMIGSMEKAIADRRMSRAHATLHPGGIAAAVDLYRHAASPNLVIIESRASAAELHAQLDALAEVCQSNTKVIVIGYANDVSVYRELLIRGVSEYVVAPIDPVSIIVAIARLYPDVAKHKLGRCFAFIGAKGGVGSSTIAHNVASTIARGHRGDVILADLDLPFGSASLGFNLDPTQGIAQALNDAGSLDDVLLERLLTKSGDHLKVLSAPATLAQSYDIEENALEPVIDLTLTHAPYVVLDIPHMWTSWAKKTLLAADEVVITAIPDLVSLRNAKNLVDFLKRARPNDAPPKLVLNQIGMPKRTEIKPDKFASTIQIEPLACIPFEPSSFSAAASKGQMIADVSAKSAISMGFPKIVQALMGYAPATKPSRKGLFPFGPRRG
jgi:pilus assembly protein CpaE